MIVYNIQESTHSHIQFVEMIALTAQINDLVEDHTAQVIKVLAEKYGFEIDEASQHVEKLVVSKKPKRKVKKKQKTSRMPPKSEGTMATESVICVRKASLQTRGYTDLSSWLRNPAHTYIGRNMVFYVGPGAEHSKWANPFSVKKYGRGECLRMYREYVLTGVNPVTKKKRKGGALVGDIEELRGKALGCWCNPDPCHGDILVELLQNSVGEGT